MKSTHIEKAFILAKPSILKMFFVKQWCIVLEHFILQYLKRMIPHNNRYIGWSVCLSVYCGSSSIPDVNTTWPHPCSKPSLSIYASSYYCTLVGSKAHPSLSSRDCKFWPSHYVEIITTSCWLLICRLGRLCRHSQVHNWSLCLLRRKLHFLVIEETTHSSKIECQSWLSRASHSCCWSYLDSSSFASCWCFTCFSTSSLLG